MSEIIIIVTLILINGCLAMSEIALISVRKSHLSAEAEKGSKSAKTALKLIGEPDKFLSTIQIGITIIGILTGVYSGSVLADDFSEILSKGGIPNSLSHPLAQGVIIVAVTYFALIFGELVPKRIGMSAAEKASKIVSRPMLLLSQIASPFVWILSKSTSFVFNMMGLSTNSEKVTEQEIKSMIQEGTDGGEVQEVEQDIVERVFLLGDLKVSSIMTHRSEIFSLDINMTISEIKEAVKQNFCETYPVVDRNFDNVRGVVSLKDFVFRLENGTFELSQVLSQPAYFHESLSVYKVLERMKQQRISQALIIDEFGSCQGIITLKDILEGLVGVMEDTHSEPDIIKRSDGEGWLVDGQCALHDFLSYFDMEHLYSNDNDFNTVGGLVLKLLEHVPHSGECVGWKSFKFEVVDMDGARIDKFLVTVETSDIGY